MSDDPKYIENFLNYILYNKGFSKNTHKAYKKDLSQFTLYLKTLEIIDPVNVKKFHIRGFISYLSENMISKRSISRKIATLKSFYKYLIKEEIIKTNPMSLIKTPSFEKKLPTFLSENIIETLIDSIEGESFISKRDKLIFEMLYATGLRSNELVSLNIEDIDEKRKIITVKMGKGGKQRIVPFNENTLLSLNLYYRFRTPLTETENALFLSYRGKRLGNRDLRRIIKKNIKSLSITFNMSPHTLRHTFATHLLNRGANIRVIQELLGHSSISTTQIYTHTSVSKLKEIYNKSHPLENEEKEN